MSNLFELTAQYMALLDMAQDPDIDAEAIRDTMEALDGEIEEKADSCAHIMRWLKNSETFLEAEEKRLKAKREALEKNRKRIAENLQKMMEFTGKTKFKTAKNSFWIQLNAPSVKLNDGITAEDIPDRFKATKAPEVSLTLIKEAIANGEDVSFARMEQTSSIRYR